MVSLETIEATSNSIDSNLNSSPRISFSAEFLDENDFISICPTPRAEQDRSPNKPTRNAEFEFLSGNISNMLSADELFCEGKLLPFWQIHQADKLNKISLKTENPDEKTERIDQINKEESRINWFIDEDPSPRPPTCTVLWKELLKLRKQRTPTLSPSSSSSSSSSSRSSDERKLDGVGNGEKAVKRIKKGLERTRSVTIRIRPVVNVPICTQGIKNSALPPLFSLRKGKLDR
ncbi:hypothetical protein ACJIZ3_013928 [Penstemon smallii]|uniref:Uncharacterized protein n=1 Tax=Penstemon smallii TaxID=265156 RepID=A0ABD3RI43_9LAMI